MSKTGLSSPIAVSIVSRCTGEPDVGADGRTYWRVRLGSFRRSDRGMSLEQPSRGRTDQTADPSPSVPGPRDVAAVDLRAWLAAVGEVAREDNWNASLDGLVSRITATCCQLLNY